MSYPATWSALVSAISAEVVRVMAAAGYPALTPEIDGSTPGILIGPQFPAELSTPPRIIFIPKEWPFSNERSVVNRTKGGTLQEQETSQRAIGRQWKMYEVRCWGCNYSDQATPAPDPILDYDAAQALCAAVWLACQNIAPGQWRSTAGRIMSNQEAGLNLVNLGKVFAFDLALDTPALDILLPFAPSDVGQSGKVDVVIGGTPVQAFP